MRARYSARNAKNYSRSTRFLTNDCDALSTPGAQAQQGGGANQPGVRWTDAQLEEAAKLAGVARKLTPKAWPNGARVAVALSFDTDTEAPLLRDGTTSLTSLSASQFGAESGIPRILSLLDRNQIPATFFVTGVDAMLHPEMVAAILKSGRNEIGVHGWIHEFTPRLADGEEEKLLDRAIDLLTKVTGKRPVGYRAPSWAFSPVTLDLILKKGFLYDSSLQALDEPYEVSLRGKPTGLVELAIDWTLTETPFLGQNGRMPSPELLYWSLPRRIRRRLQRADDVRADAASVLERAPRADAAPRTVRHLHAVTPWRVVRDVRRDREVREGAGEVVHALWRRRSSDRRARAGLTAFAKAMAVRRSHAEAEDRRLHRASGDRPPRASGFVRAQRRQWRGTHVPRARRRRVSTSPPSRASRRRA